MAKEEGSASMRMFGSVVKSLRDAPGITTDELATSTGYSRSLVVKIERGERMPPPLFVEKAEELFGSGEVLKRAAAHLERSQFPHWFEPYADLEKAAVSLYKYDSLAINGLLQTEEYAREVFLAHRPTLNADEIEHRVQARMERQGLLSRTPTAQIAFVVAECVLHWPVGGPVTHKAQLMRLLSTYELRNVSIQVMPMSIGAHAGFEGPMTLLETPDRQLLAYLEVQGMGILLDDRDQVSELNQRYAMIRSQALSMRESAKLIEQIAGEL